MEPKKEKSLSKFLTSKPLKKMMTQLLLSLSIFSFIFSYYSLCSSSLFHPRKFPCPSANLFNPHSHVVNKNFIFLICNALLVFLSKTSGLVRSSSGFDPNDMLQKRIGDGLLHSYNNFLQRPKEDERILNEERKDISMESDEELRGICDYHFEAHAEIHDQKETENLLLLDDIIEEEEFMDQQEVVEEQELSTEELNKKFEEFIRKTKEEIMINEARQLVIVK
ncbi:uncharacterized protein [Primulina huaijiensis]|uniref:uncharacterized protein n=1 Tax=Primulina huaijiensis TaxID=1492673 RepID=UPI003CC787ED